MKVYISGSLTRFRLTVQSPCISRYSHGMLDSVESNMADKIFLWDINVMLKVVPAPVRAVEISGYI